MVIIYALTCPVGVAVGIGISDSYDASSVKALATQVSSSNSDIGAGHLRT